MSTEYAMRMESWVDDLLAREKKLLQFIARNCDPCDMTEEDTAFFNEHCNVYLVKQD
jgi:hypothetical protein